jgi:HECT-domain (ubiquitin-transferase)
MQVAAFRAGFEEVFPLRSLGAFYEDEIEAMLCGTGAARDLSPSTHNLRLQTPSTLSTS